MAGSPHSGHLILKTRMFTTPHAIANNGDDFNLSAFIFALFGADCRCFNIKLQVQARLDFWTVVDIVHQFALQRDNFIFFVGCAGYFRVVHYRAVGRDDTGQPCGESVSGKDILSGEPFNVGKFIFGAHFAQRSSPKPPRKRVI